MSLPHANVIEQEGFKPLKKTATFGSGSGPQGGPEAVARREMDRKLSFVGDTEEDPHSLWEGSSWNKLERARGKSMERANSFIGYRGGGAAAAAGNAAIVVVDPFSTGAHLAAAVSKAGYKCARVFSIWDSPVAALVQEGLVLDYCATIQHNDRIADQDAATNDTVAAIRALPFPVLAIIAGAETGVELADRLSTRMGLRSNGEQGSLARRNKYHMGEAVRAAGVRAVKQQACTSLPQLRAFCASLPCRRRAAQAAATPPASAHSCRLVRSAANALRQAQAAAATAALRACCAMQKTAASPRPAREAERTAARLREAIDASAVRLADASASLAQPPSSGASSAERAPS
jgi:hypothetical protein